MTTLHINLPDDLAAKLKDRAAESGHASVDEFVRDLLQDHVELLSLGKPPGIYDEDDPALAAELLRRINDPTPMIDVTPQFWIDLKRRFRERLDHRDEKP